MCRQMLHIASVFIHLLVISILYNYIVWICCLSVGEPGVWREHVLTSKNKDFICWVLVILGGWQNDPSSILCTWLYCQCLVDN